VVGDAATSDDADGVSPAVAGGDRETSIRRSLEVLLSLGSEAAIESGEIGLKASELEPFADRLR